MLNIRILRLISSNRLPVPYILNKRQFSPDFTNPFIEKKTKEKTEEKQIPFAVRNKYKIFKDEDSTEIFDVEEEKQRYQKEEEPLEYYNDEFVGINLNRGVSGVYEIEDLVDVLRKEQAQNVFVCSVPQELKYVDYMVVVTGRSYRHMISIASFVRRVYKKKRKETDILPKIEGDKSCDWIALDLGNIALHIFSANARVTYDLESLWSIGTTFDKEYNKPKDPLVELFEQNSLLYRN